MTTSVGQKGEPRIDSRKQSQLKLISDKGANSISGKQRIFNKRYWNNQTFAYYKILDLDTEPTSFTKTNSKWITDLNVKCKTIKFPDSKEKT